MREIHSSGIYSPRTQPWEPFRWKRLPDGTVEYGGGVYGRMMLYSAEEWDAIVASVGPSA